MTLLVGGIIGWIAGLVMGTDHQVDVLANVLLGVVGSMLGLWLAGLVGLAVAGHAAPVAGLAGRSRPAHRDRARARPHAPARDLGLGGAPDVGDQRSGGESPSTPARRASWASAAFLTSMWRLSRTRASRYVTSSRRLMARTRIWPMWRSPEWSLSRPWSRSRLAASWRTKKCRVLRTTSISASSWA